MVAATRKYRNLAAACQAGEQAAGYPRILSGVDPA